jgi:hypothetical protein
MGAIYTFGLEKLPELTNFVSTGAGSPPLFYGKTEPEILSDAPVNDRLRDLAIEKAAYAVLSLIDALPASENANIDAAIALRSVLQARFPGEDITGGVAGMNCPRRPWDTVIPDARELIDAMVGMGGLPRETWKTVGYFIYVLRERISCEKPPAPEDDAALGTAFE